MTQNATAAPQSPAPQAPAQNTSAGQQPAQQPATAPAQATGRMVYGVDGKQPVTEREFILAQMERAKFRGDPAADAATSAPQVPQATQDGDQQKTGQHAATREQEILKQHNDLAVKYQRLSRYEGIIGALESDPNLVDILQREINRTAKLGGGGQDEFERVLGEPEDGDSRHGQDSNSASRKSATQEILEAEERGRQQAAAQLELRTVMAEMMQGGATMEEANAFVAFVLNPTGITAKDMLELYNLRNKRTSQQTVPQTQAPRQQAQQLPPRPLAAVNGGTDRPGSDRRFVAADESGVRHFGGDPNNY